MVSKFRIISISLTAIIITFTAGFYTAIHFEQINFITSPATILAFATIIGVSFNVSKIIVDWLTDKMNTPVLQYNGIIKRGMKYYLRIKRIKGKHQAKSVKGFITVENTDINNTPIIWDSENNPSIDIGSFRDIHLFTYNIPAIFFPLINNDFKRWRQFLIGNFETTNKILVRIESENARIPFTPYIKSFDDIRSIAVDETIAKVEN